MKFVIFFTIVLISGCVAMFRGNVPSDGTCKPNSIFTGMREICICDSRNVKICETREEAEARLMLEWPSSGPDEEGFSSACSRCGNNIRLDLCTVGKTYKAAGKNCLCGNDGQLNCT